MNIENKPQDWFPLFEKAHRILSALSIPISEWSFGGGTALMLYYGHRYSRDIDIFLTDTQLLTRLSPRLNDHIADEKGYRDYQEQSNLVKISFSNGQYLDFIASPHLTPHPFQMREQNGLSFNIETPEEIVIKKIFYRAEYFKTRDIFDLAVILEDKAESLLQLLPIYKNKVDILIERMAILKGIYEKELSELMLYRDQVFVSQSFQKALEFIKACKTH